MANQSLISLFSDYGEIVHGDRFVGRKKEIAQIEQRVLGKNYGNLAVMGLPRIGKSSLVWEAIMTKKEELLKEKTIAIYFSAGVFHNSKDFFKSLVRFCDDELSICCDDERYSKILERCVNPLNEENDSIEIIHLVTKYFKFIRRILDYKVIFVIDEFDGVQKYFELPDFQLLRELSYNPDTKICVVTCSRKTIQDIESTNGAISNFYGTFDEIRLAMYSSEDLDAYWGRLDNTKFDKEYQQQAQYYVGGHPFLLDFYNYTTMSLDGSETIANRQLQLLEHFKTIQKTMKDEKLLDKSIQLILGPVYDVTTIDEEKLLKYGFIRKIFVEEKMETLGRMIGWNSKGQTYACFSDFLTLYFMEEHLTSVEYWPLWTKTEKEIRGLIKTVIKNKYGSDWETSMQAELGNSQNWQTKFDTLKHTRKTTRDKFKNSSNNLVDYTLTRDMYDIFMAPLWIQGFSDVFNGQKREWATIFNFLSDVRNPVAHNNLEFIGEDEVTKAKNYCEMILRAINNWKSLPLEE